MAWEHQLDCLWREGLCPRALVNLEGDSTQEELGFLATGRGHGTQKGTGERE